MAVALEINEALFTQIDKELAGIGVVHRTKALKAGIQRAANLVKARYRDYIPLPGYQGDKPGLKPLRNTIKIKVKEFTQGGGVYAIVGAEYPAGAHSHLLEEGHKQVVSRGPNKGRHVGFVRGRHPLQRAVDATATDRDAAIINGIREAIEEAKKQGV